MRIYSENPGKKSESIQKEKTESGKEHIELKNRLHILNEIARNSCQSQDLKEILDMPLCKTLEVMGLTIGVIYLCNDTTNVLEVATYKGLSDEHARAHETIKPGEGIAGRAAQLGKTVYSENVQCDENDSARNDTIGSLLCVPIKSKKRLIGVMEIGSHEKRLFDQQEIEFVTSICSYLGLAMENWLLFHETVRKDNEGHAIYDVTSVISASFDIDHIFDTLIEKTVETLKVPMCMIGIIDHNNNISYAYSNGIPEEITNTVTVNLKDDYINGTVARTGKPLYILDLQESELTKYPELAKKYNIRSYLSIPITTKKKSIGILSAFTHEIRMFTGDEIQLLTNFARQAGIALECAQLYEQIKIEKDSYEILIEKSPVGIYIIQDGKIVYANNELLQISGHTISDFGIELDNVIALNSLPMVNSQIAKKINRDPTAKEQYAVQIVRPDGTIRDLVVRSVVLDYKGKKAIQGSVIDVTEEKRSMLELKKRNLELEALNSITSVVNQPIDVDSILDEILTKVLELTRIKIGGIYLYNADADIYVLKRHRGVSEKFAKQHSIINHQFTTFLPVWETAQVVCVHNVNEQPDSPIKETTLREGILSFAGVPLVSKGKVLGILNIGSHKLHQYTQDEVRLLELLGKQIGISIDNSMLFDELSDSYKELQMTYKQLKESDKIKSDFVANISHEFRTPLTSIKGYIEMMYDEKLGDVTPQQHTGFEVILRNINRLIRMIQDISYLSTFDEKRAVYQKISLEEIVRDVVADMKSIIESKKLNVDMSVSSNLKPIEAHPDGLIRVITNLISNAIKFTPENGNINVRISMKDDQHIHFEVEDNGAGIPPKEVDRIFDRFYQVDSGLSRKYGGIGVGLYICKIIVEEHHGVIWVKSELGKGSTFHVILPATLQSQNFISK
jgi:PAS domain S-box-containing protein